MVIHYSQILRGLNNKELTVISARRCVWVSGVGHLGSSRGMLQGIGGRGKGKRPVSDSIKAFTIHASQDVEDGSLPLTVLFVTVVWTCHSSSTSCLRSPCSLILSEQVSLPRSLLSCRPRGSPSSGHLVPFFPSLHAQQSTFAHRRCWRKTY